MYFAVGGRNTQSGLYRVTYDGGEPTRRAVPAEGRGDLRGPRACGTSSKRSTAARAEGRRGRLALPGPPRPLHPLGRPGGDRVSGPGASGASGPWPRSSSPEAALNALLALTQVERTGPGAPSAAATRPRTRPSATGSSRRSTGSTGTGSIMARQLDLLRVYQVVFNRFGRPDDATVARLIARFDPHYPAASPRAERRAVPGARLPPGPGRRRQDRRPARSRRRPRKSRSTTPGPCASLKAGWTPALREAYFSWFPKAGPVQGRQQLPRLHGEHQARRDGQPERGREGRAQADPRGPAGPDGPVRRRGPSGRSSRNGRSTSWSRWSRRASRIATSTAAARSSPPPSASPATASTTRAAALGPDLSGVAGRFSARDLLESIVVPSKTISDQYEAVIDRHHRRPGRHRPDRQPPRRQPDRSAPTCSTRATWSTSRASEIEEMKALAGLDDARGAARHPEPRRDPRPVRLPALARRPRDPMFKRLPASRRRPASGRSAGVGRASEPDPASRPAHPDRQSGWTARPTGRPIGSHPREAS